MHTDIVLSGSSIKFPAHIGWLEAVLELGFEPQKVAATSGGALVAGLWASGMPIDEMWEDVLKMNLEESIISSICL